MSNTINTNEPELSVSSALTDDTSSEAAAAPKATLFPLDFPRAFGAVTFEGGFRYQDEDFFVEESLGFELSNDGEHQCLYIEKQGHNTHWVAAELARHVGIAEHDVGVCGRKDRHAITRQWFSLYDPLRKATDLSGFAMDGVTILQQHRHNKKLRLGMHEHNRFVIRLRDVVGLSGETLTDTCKQHLLDKIEAIYRSGVPNYFGEQRFGRGGGNLQMADQWFCHKKMPPRKQKGMVLSAARSYVFNQVLSQRVLDGSWQEAIDGDVLDSSGQPTAPLWGRGRMATQGQALAIEQKVVTRLAAWCERMEYQGLKQERRSLRLLPQQGTCEWQESDLLLSFALPVGTFATSVLAEIVRLKASDQ